MTLLGLKWKYKGGAARGVINRTILCDGVDVDFLTKGLVMQYPTMEIELLEEEALSFDVSDEALENAVASETQAFTLGSCSGLSVCPG